MPNNIHGIINIVGVNPGVDPIQIIKLYDGIFQISNNQTN